MCLIAVKTRVTPLKAMSIPHLELMVGVRGAKLTASIFSILTEKSGRVVYWSDRINVICWIHNPGSNYNVFVTNRVREILTLCNPDQWRHIPYEKSRRPAVMRSIGIHVSIYEFVVAWTSFS